MMLTQTEKEELEQLRKSAAMFIRNPLDKAFFELEKLLDKPQSLRIDSVMPSSYFYVLARALIELKREVIKDDRD